MSSPSTVVTLAELRQAINRSLDLCEALLGPDVDLRADNYWLIEPADAFNMKQQPVPVVGQLSNDLEELRCDRPPVPQEAWHELMHLLGPLTRLIALAR